MNLLPRLSRQASCSPIPNGWRLAIPDGSSLRYRLAQLDDQQGIPRKAYPWRPPLTLSLRARISDAAVPGTWGFGLWNDPFGFSFVPGGFFRLPALPNAAWFFYASPKNYLSFRDDQPAQGFLAQVFRSPRFHPSLITAGLALPFSRRTTRRRMSRIIAEDSAGLSVDVTEWHAYRLEWQAGHCIFWVDELVALETRVSPGAPLGLVLWIDNQFAAFRPNGEIGWGVEKNPTGVWLEIEGLSMQT